jgi:hypothetical protein
MERRTKGSTQEIPRSEQYVNVSVQTNSTNKGDIRLICPHEVIQCAHSLFNCVVSSDLCDSIAELRKKIQRLNKANVLYLDETHMRLNEAPNRTLVCPGESEYVVVEDTGSYAKRFDMIACCTGKEVLPPIIYTPD